MPKNRQHNRKTKYPDKVTKPKRLVLVRIFLFCPVGIKIQYFPTAPFFNYLIIFVSPERIKEFVRIASSLGVISNSLSTHLTSKPRQPDKMKS